MGILQIPTGTVVARQKAVCCREVPAKHLAAPPAVKANHEIPAVGSVDGNSRLSDHGDFGGSPKLGQGSVDDRDKVWEVARRDGVVRNVAAHNLGDETGVDRFGFRHLFPPAISTLATPYRTVPHRKEIKTEPDRLRLGFGKFWRTQ